MKNALFSVSDKTDEVGKVLAPDRDEEVYTQTERRTLGAVGGCSPFIYNAGTKQGKAARVDYKYQREGVCNVSLTVEPLSGKRFTQVRTQRTRSDEADFMRELLDERYQQAEKAVSASARRPGSCAGNGYRTRWRHSAAADSDLVHLSRAMYAHRNSLRELPDRDGIVA